MTAIELCKYIQNVEWHWVAVDEGQRDVFLMPSIWQVEDFVELLDSTIFDDGIRCTLKERYIVFEMQEICEYYGIDLTEVFPVNRR